MRNSGAPFRRMTGIRVGGSARPALLRSPVFGPASAMVSILAPSVGGVTFVPGARTKARALQPFEDGVPDHLSGALWEWCAGFLEEETGSAARIGDI